MKLYFMRHAEAVDHTPTDVERELTPRGIERTKRAAKAIRKLGIQPAMMYSSPRVRAKQTADIVADALGLKVTVTPEMDVYFNVESVQNLISGLEMGDELMVFGHNPSMSDTLEAICGANVNLKKGSLARIDLASTRIIRGELVYLITPKIFDTLTE